MIVEEYNVDVTVSVVVTVAVPDVMVTTGGVMVTYTTSPFSPQADSRLTSRRAVWVAPKNESTQLTTVNTQIRIQARYDCDANATYYCPCRLNRFRERKPW